jgi:enoyl-CoA hydratase/carnithine racemase
MQHLSRLMGRGRALEVMLSGEDYDAELAERYGWVNRALPADELGDCVGSLAQRIARFPPAALATIKDRVAAITLAPADDLRRDSDLFAERASEPAAQTRTQAAMKRGFRTPEGELALGRMLDDLAGG